MIPLPEEGFSPFEVGDTTMELGAMNCHMVPGWTISKAGHMDRNDMAWPKQVLNRRCTKHLRLLPSVLVAIFRVVVTLQRRHSLDF